MATKGITILEGDDLAHFLSALGINIEDTDIYRVRIWPAKDGSGAKFKVNGGMWTLALGEADQ